MFEFCREHILPTHTGTARAFFKALNCYLALNKTAVPNAVTFFTVRAAGTSPLLLLGKVELDNIKSLSTRATKGSNFFAKGKRAL